MILTELGGKRTLHYALPHMNDIIFSTSTSAHLGVLKLPHLCTPLLSPIYMNNWNIKY